MVSDLNQKRTTKPKDFTNVKYTNSYTFKDFSF